MMLNYGTTVDHREPKVVREYSEDEEGRLLREFDIAVNDSAVTRAEIEQVVEALRRERERIRQARRDTLTAEIQNARRRQEELAEELREGRERIATEEQEGQERIVLEEQEGQKKITQEAQEEQEKNDNEIEVNRKQLMAELQEAKERTEAKIQSRKGKIEEAMAKFDKAYEEGTIHKKALTLYKDPESKVYTAAKTELERCEKNAKSAQTRVKRLVREISHLEQDLGSIGKLLDRLSDSREIEEAARQEQEDEMWAEYREEQARQKADKEGQIDEAIRHKQEQEKGQEIREDRDAEDAVNAGYADGLNPEQEPIEPGEYKIPVKQKEEETQIPQESAKPQQPTGPQPKPNTKPEKWKVESVTFTIEGGMQPVYRAILSNGKEQKEEMMNVIDITHMFLDPEFDSNQIQFLKEQKGIQKPEKYYDKNLSDFLRVLDIDYGTKSLPEYQKLLADKEIIHKCPQEYEKYMKLNYDFSGLLVRPTTEMKKLQKMANMNSIKGVVSEFKGRPNFLTRLMKRMFTKSLPEEARIKMPRVQASEKALDELGAQMQENSQEIDEIEPLKTKVLEQWSELHTDPGFDIEVFIEQNFVEKERMSEEANRYRAMQDEYEEGIEKDPYAAFKKRIQEQAEHGVPPVVEEKEQTEEGRPIVVNSKDITVIDKDGAKLEMDR